MKNLYSSFNLQEAKEQLDQIIEEFDSLGDGEFFVSMQHLYHHLNTAYNCKDIKQDECFKKAWNDDFYNEMEQFPKDLI